VQGHRKYGTLAAIAKLHRAFITRELAVKLVEIPAQLEKIANLVGIFAHCERQLDSAKWSF
jgi:hypothetical protein